MFPRGNWIRALLFGRKRSELIVKIHSERLRLSDDPGLLSFSFLLKVRNSRAMAVRLTHLEILGLEWARNIDMFSNRLKKYVSITLDRVNATTLLSFHFIPTFRAFIKLFLVAKHIYVDLNGPTDVKLCFMLALPDLFSVKDPQIREHIHGNLSV